MIDTRKTKKIAGVDCSASCFAYIGDENDITTWKLCLRIPGDAQKTVNQVKNSLARFHETKSLPAGMRSALFNRLVGAATVLGVAVAKDRVTTVTPEEIDMLLAERTANDLVSKLDLDWNK
jgi:hypothetical protein